MQTLLEESTDSADKAAPLYNVVIHNCSCHTFADVTFGLMGIVKMGMRDAELKAKEVDFFGRGTVATADKSTADTLASRLRTEVISASGTQLQTSVEPA